MKTAKYEFSKIALLDKSLKKNGIDESTIKTIMESGEKIKSTSSPAVKSKWCCNAMDKMDELLDKKAIQKIREDCACCLGGKREKICREINCNFKTAEERIAAINETHYVFGNEIKISGKGKYEVAFFDEAALPNRCVCMKGARITKIWSNNWCYCCGGHVKHHLETVLGKKVKVKILSSALTSMGKKNCRFELREI